MCKNKVDKQVKTMVSEETFHLLQQLAAKESISVSAVVRRMILEQLEEKILL